MNFSWILNFLWIIAHKYCLVPFCFLRCNFFLMKVYWNINSFFFAILVLKFIIILFFPTIVETPIRALRPFSCGYYKDALFHSKSFTEHTTSMVLPFWAFLLSLLTAIQSTSMQLHFQSQNSAEMRNTRLASLSQNCVAKDIF